MPAAAHLLRNLSSAVRNRWPIATKEEIPAPLFLPPAEPEKKKKKRIKFKSRRDTWREKTPKEKAKERTAKAEAEAEVKVKADGDGDAVKATTGEETPTTREEIPVKATTGEETPDFASDDRASCSGEEDDPLSSPSNRLLLRTTAAAALASLARTQRLWDEDDASDAFETHSGLDAIDVEAWTPPDANRAAGLDAHPLVAEALEAWYVARGGDAAGMPTRDEIEEAREGARRGFAASLASGSGRLVDAGAGAGVGFDSDRRDVWTSSGGGCVDGGEVYSRTHTSRWRRRTVRATFGSGRVRAGRRGDGGWGRGRRRSLARPRRVRVRYPAGWTPRESSPPFPWRRISWMRSLARIRTRSASRWRRWRRSWRTATVDFYSSRRRRR